MTDKHLLQVIKCLRGQTDHQIQLEFIETRPDKTFGGIQQVLFSQPLVDDPPQPLRCPIGGDGHTFQIALGQQVQQGFGYPVGPKRGKGEGTTASVQMPGDIGQGIPVDHLHAEQADTLDRRRSFGKTADHRLTVPQPRGTIDIACGTKTASPGTPPPKFSQIEVGKLRKRRQQLGMGSLFAVGELSPF